MSHERSIGSPQARPVIFIHIPKTGGTSIVEYVRRRVAPRELSSHGDFLLVNDERPLPGREVVNKRFISGHFGFDYVRDYLGDSFSFTILRDPLARVLSFYRFCLHEDMQRKFAVARLAAQLGLNEFCVSREPEVCEVLDSQQTWQLASMYWTVDREARGQSCPQEILSLATHNLQLLSYVGFTEQFSEVFRTVIPKVGLSLPGDRVPQQLKTRDGFKREDLHPDVELELRERLSMDYALYQFATEMRAKQSPA